MIKDIEYDEQQSILDILQSKYPILANFLGNVLSGNKDFSEETILFQFIFQFIHYVHRFKYY